MWCSTCQQETPGVAHATTGRIVCSRCQQPARKGKVAQAQICDEGIALDEQPTRATVAAAPLPKNDDWTTDQRVRNLARELKRPTTTIKKPGDGIFPDHRRFEPPHDLLRPHDLAAHADLPATAPPLPTSAALHPRRTESSQVMAWFVITIGVLTFASGLWLIGWTLAAKQLQHWNLALGLAIGGQGTLILGLVLVVSRLWRHSRYSAGKLQDVQNRLGQLQQTAEVLTTMRAGGSAPTFYAELARGASPHMLLTNLKGQLDQLATRLGSGF